MRRGRRLDTPGKMHTIDAMDGPHPQLIEIEQRIAWFLAHPEFDQCVIVEPESQSIVRFRIPVKSMRGYRHEKLGRLMEIRLTPDEAVAGEAIVKKMGFEQHGHVKGTWDGERGRIFPEFVKQTTTARVAARDVLKVMDEVFGVGDAWFWTFQVDDPNQWPDPLPKPNPWPPAAKPLAPGEPSAG